MSFWNFLRRMIVLDWLFGGHNHGESHWEKEQRDNQCDNYYSHNDYNYGGYDNSHYDDDTGLNNDYDSDIFDDNLDTSTFDDGFGSGTFDDSFDSDSGMFDNDF